MGTKVPKVCRLLTPALRIIGLIAILMQFSPGTREAAGRTDEMPLPKQQGTLELSKPLNRIFPGRSDALLALTSETNDLVLVTMAEGEIEFIGGFDQEPISLISAEDDFGQRTALVLTPPDSASGKPSIRVFWASDGPFQEIKFDFDLPGGFRQPAIRL
jgi:hypothetical protein